MKKLIYFLGVTVIPNGILCAADIIANPGNVIANNGNVYATYNVQGTTLIAYSNLTIGTNATMGDYLRVGGNSNTPASKSVQIGQYATTEAFNSLVVGRYNLNKAKDGTTAPNATTWNDNDPLLAVGNGTGVTNTATPSPFTRTARSP